MKVKLPLVGQFWVSRKEQTVEIVKKGKEKIFDGILGGFLDMGRGKLSTEKTVSSKLLQANTEWVYRNNDVIAKEVSKIDFELYSVGLKGGEIVYNEIEEHPLLDLLDKFNNQTTKADFIYSTQSHKKLTGDAFWLLQRNGSQIEAIYMLPPDKVELVLGNFTTATDNLVTGYRYKDTINGEQIDVLYKPEDIIHFKTPNPKNPFRGYGAVEAAAETIDVDTLANLAAKQFFQNGAITNFVLSTDSKLTQDQVKRLKAELRAGNNGASNAFNTMILGGGLKPQSISLSNKDMEFLPQLEWFRDKIMVIFGNTKASLGIVDDVNRASHEDSMATWKRTTIKPDMDAIVNTINEFLVPQFGKNLILGYCDPVPEDRTDDVNEAVTLYQAGLITQNEGRELADFESTTDGDTFFTGGTGQLTTDDEATDQEVEDEKRFTRLRTKQNLGKVPDALKHIDLPKLLRQRKMFTQKRINQEYKEAAKPMIREMLKGKRVEVKTDEPILHAQFTNQVVMEYYEKQMHIVDVYENQFEEKVKQFIGKIEKKVLANLDDEVNYLKNKSLYDDEDLMVEAQLDFTPLLMQEAVLAGQEAYKLIKHDEVYMPYKLHDKIKENVSKFTQSMLDTDRETLTNIIEDGIKSGQSVPEIRDAITARFQDITKKQSAVITRTEVLRVNNMATEDAYIQSGVVEAKQWLTAGATDECAEYEGQIESLGGNFYDDTTEFADGDPPLHPNCRCVLLPIVIGAKSFNADMMNRIKELEEQIDKRTKEWRDMKLELAGKDLEQQAYIAKLEELLGISNE